MPKRVLMVLSSHDVMGVSGKKTGSWFDEIATPYYAFKERGFEVVLVSPKGGAAPLDPLSVAAPFTTPATTRFEADPVAVRALANTLTLSSVDYRGFDGAFFPGGYGLLWDLASDSLAIRLIEDLVAEDKPVAFVCHAPGVLRDAKKRNGEPLVKGRKVTGFTDAEDDELHLLPHLLFSVEGTLKANGGIYSRSKKNWDSYVIEDGALITGQNPGSAANVATAFAAQLS